MDPFVDGIGALETLMDVLRSRAPWPTALTVVWGAASAGLGFACSEAGLNTLNASTARDAGVGPVDVGSADAGAAVDAGFDGVCLDVTPPQVIFGLTTVLAPSVRSVLITNLCFVDLTITDVFVDSSEGDLSTSAMPDILAPGEVLVVEVVFAPSDPRVGRWEADLVIRSNDPNRPEARVRLFAEDSSEKGCRLLAAPEALVFPAVPVGLTERLSVAVTVQSTNHRCSVLAFAQRGSDAGGPFVVSESTRRFGGLQTGDTATVTVEFTPPMPQAYTGELNLSPSGWDGPLVLPLSGTGVP